MGLDFTLIGQLITFLIFVGITAKFVWPKLIKSMEERRQKIADGLAAADQGQEALLRAERDAKAKIVEAKEKAAVIIEQATQRAHRFEEDAKEETRRQCERMKNSAEEEINRQAVQTQTALKNELADLVILGVEKIIGQKMSAANDKALVDQFVSEIASASGTSGVS